MGLLQYVKVAQMASGGIGLPAQQTANSWPRILSLLYLEARRLLIPILILVLILATAAAVARFVLPRSYDATAEILIDPRGLQVFENELVNGQYDANAGVNYVESQIHVVLSTPVLTRALVYAAGETMPDDEIDTPVSAAVIDAVRRNVSVSRAERSYLLSITATGDTPQDAANLANAIVKAYIEEDSRSQADVANRLTGSLASRLVQLRETLAASEERVETYRRQNSLNSTDNQLIVDQQLTAAVKALGDADARLSEMRVRNDQLLVADINTIGTIASVEDQSRLNALFERQVATKEEYARLSTQLGARHPSLQLVSGQLAEVNSLLQAEFTRIVNSSATALRRAEQERDRASEIVNDLTQQSTDARQSSIELRTLQEQVTSDKALLTSFENRSRQMAEFARIDSANIRQISPAYAPEQGMGLRAVVLWGIAGAFLAGLAGAAYVVIRVLKKLLPEILPTQPVPAVPVIPRREQRRPGQTPPTITVRQVAVRQARIEISS